MNELNRGRGWVQTTTISSEETPPGLQILADLDKIAVHQHLETIELVTDFETENKYNILNSDNHQQILYAQEHTTFWNRMCCGALRSFEMSIYNVRNEEILHLTRYKRCQCCLYFCCLQKMEVFAPPGNLLGTIKQKWHFCNPKFIVKDNNGNSLFKISGPCCVFGTVDFMVTSAQDGKDIGLIKKKWGGLGAEAFTDADVFGIDFEQDLSVEVNNRI